MKPGSNAEQVAEENEAIENELAELVAKPRTQLTEMKIRKLLKRAGYPETAKKFARRKLGGRP